ncbi:MAG: 7-cyano-7-deazaguanine synthase QueC [Nitrospirae bacterium]|nr:7-cyano-7-deazaguanine synthase QueC [Nitrospirota bacterium]
MTRPAVVLLSGGLDSAVTMALAREEGRSVYALTILYGQRHAWEVEAARKLASRQGAALHRVLPLDISSIAVSALTGHSPVPREASSPAGAERGPAIPSTYVPARNTILLGLALAWTESLGGEEIFIGVNAVDYSGYPDCRPEFLRAFESLANLATKAGVERKSSFRVRAPLIQLSKAQIIREGHRLGVDFSQTHSCYDPPAPAAACGSCDSCRIRRDGFRQAGIPDPTRYVLETN